jgi:phospholipase C
MGRAAFLFVPAILLCGGALLLHLDGCASSSQRAAPSGKIEHVVIIFQENRTPDNLFHDPVLIANGADIASSGLNSSGGTVPLTSIPLGIDYDLGHGHSDFVTMYDNGKMDGANNIPASCSPNCPPHPQYAYVQASDVEPYFQLAEQYTFADRMFQTNQGPSFPAHQFILSGTSAPTATSHLFAAGNTSGAGCAAPPNALVALIDPQGRESSSMYPCFEHPTLSDEIQNQGLSWRYYAPAPGSIWTAPNAIDHICGPNAQPPNATACVGSEWTNNVVLYSKENPDPILTDIANGQLATVSWVIPSIENSDHAGLTDWTGGPSWVASIVNAIGNSSYWSNTAIFISWDDWGGWYDHVPPSQVIDNGTSWGSGYVYGFRVPLLVVSPYAKAAYISHVNHDFGSILKFIEENFGLSSLGYADAYADDLSDCFNFNQQPLQFQKVPARLKVDYFLHNHKPPTGPDDD